MTVRPLLPVAAAALAVSAAAIASGPSIDIVAFGGQIPPGGDGSAITSLNAPFTNSLGQPGFTGVLASGDRFVWVDSGIVWLNADGPLAYSIELTGTEATMGISDAGGFIYSPNADGEDSVFTHQGLLKRGTDEAPGLPGLFLTFNSRPTMKPDGTAWWIAGYSLTKGGNTAGRVLYVCTDLDDPKNSTTPILVSFEEIEGFQIGTTGIGFGYDVSDDSSQRIVQLTMQGVPTNSNSFVYVGDASGGSLALRQGNIVSEDDGTTWNAFRSPSINNAGDWVIAGNTSGGPSANSEFLAVNGAIAMRRGDTIDGVTLLSNWAIRAASINNLGQVAYIWEGGSGASVTGALFVGDSADLAGTSVVIAQIGQDFDSTGDGMVDVTLTDFNASAVVSPGLDFSDHPWIHAEVKLRDIATQLVYDAIVRFPIKCDGGNPDLNGDGTVDGADLGILLNAWGSDDAASDLNGDGVVDGADLGILLNAWGTAGGC